MTVPVLRSPSCRPVATNRWSPAGWATARESLAGSRKAAIVAVTVPAAPRGKGAVAPGVEGEDEPAGDVAVPVPPLPHDTRATAAVMAAAAVVARPSR